MPEIPKEWKTAGGGEEELDYIFYDLTASGTTASATLTFFDTSESASGKAVCNMEIAGQLPSTQRFLIKKIEVLIDVNAAAGDSADVLDAAILEMYVQNKRLWGAPAIYHAPPVHTSITRTAELGGAVRIESFEFDKYVALNGGVPFRVEMLIGKTAVSASTDITILLRGRLVRPA